MTIAEKAPPGSSGRRRRSTVVGALICALALLAAACGGDDDDETTSVEQSAPTVTEPAATAEPRPEPTATPASVPEPTAEPAPEPTVTQEPEFMPDPASYLVTYIEAYGLGDFDQVLSMHAEQCQEWEDEQGLRDDVAEIAFRYPGVTAFDITSEIDGNEAAVTYSTTASSLVYKQEKWIFENGSWHRNWC